MSIIYTIQPYDDIQNALDIVDSYGGGILYLNPTDIYYPTSDLISYNNITINGNGSIIDFNNQPFGIKIIGTALDHIVNPSLTQLQVINSTTIGVETAYTDNNILNILDNVQVSGCAVGVSIDNAYAPALIGTFSENGINCQISNSSAIETRFGAFLNSTTGDGLVLDTCSSSTIFDTGLDDNFGNGASLTDCHAISFVSLSVTGNTGDGIELVSGNTNIQLNDIEFSGNGGYGMNIVDATTEDTIISITNFSNNSSGAVNDLGTGTLIRTNVGVADN